MKKILFSLLFLLFFGISFATVGGPTLIDDIHYDQDQNTVRYTKTFYDGLGGSEIHKYTLATQQDQLITQLQDLIFEENRLMSDLSKIRAYFTGQGFVPLKEFQIDKLPIKISLTLDYFNQIKDNESSQRVQVPPYQYTEDPENYMMSGYIVNFGWTNKIYLNNELKSEREISTCRLDPINYRGFGLPNLDTIFIITTAAKKNCFEGGYIGEELHTIQAPAPSSEYFLAQESNLYQPYNYVENQTFQATPGGLWIQPQISGENIVQGIVPVPEVIEETKPIGLWGKIKEWINKIIKYLGL